MKISEEEKKEYDRKRTLEDILEFENFISNNKGDNYSHCIEDKLYVYEDDEPRFEFPNDGDGLETYWFFLLGYTYGIRAQKGLMDPGAWETYQREEGLGVYKKL